MYPHIGSTRNSENMQRLIISFKQFERKLDKLQDDVSQHGSTLTELRGMVSRLSGQSIPIQQFPHKPHKRTAGNQYEEKQKEQDTKGTDVKQQGPKAKIGPEKEVKTPRPAHHKGDGKGRKHIKLRKSDAAQKTKHRIRKREN